MICTTPGCGRTPMASSGGWVLLKCETHVRALVSGAFGPVSSMVVGGVPLDPSLTAEQVPLGSAVSSGPSGPLQPSGGG